MKKKIVAILFLDWLLTTCDIKNNWIQFIAPDGIISGDHAIFQVADSADGLYLSQVNVCVTYDLMKNYSMKTVH